MRLIHDREMIMQQGHQERKKVEEHNISVRRHLREIGRRGRVTNYWLNPISKWNQWVQGLIADNSDGEDVDDQSDSEGAYLGQNQS